MAEMPLTQGSQDYHQAVSTSHNREDGVSSDPQESIQLQTIRELDGKYYQQISSSSECYNETQVKVNEVVKTSGRCEYPSVWKKKLSGLSVFVICYGIAGIWMTTLGSLLGSQITSIERHLGISSSKTGLILSCNDIGYLMAVLFGSHIGKYTHIPRCLSLSGLVFGLSVIAMSFGRLEEPRVWQNDIGNQSSEENKGIQYLCSLDDLTNASLVANSTFDGAPSIRSWSIKYPSLSWAYWLFVVSACLGGMVKSYRIPLLTHYVETNIKYKSKSGLYLGSSFSAMVFGPPLALLLGSYISSLPVDLKETTMSKFDQRWVGAWWIGFIIVGVGCLLFSVPIMFFPKHIKTSLKEHDEKKNDKSKTESIKKVFIDMPRSLCRIFRCPVYVLALVAGCIEGLAFSGWFAFSQKYIEIQFNKSSQQVSMTTGLIIILTLALGTFMGGYITSRLKLGLRGCAIYNAIVSVLTTVLDALYLILGCGNSDIVGLGALSEVPFTECGCSSNTFFVCGDNNVDYRTPCLAGCTNVTNMIFSNCSEIDGGSARPGLCTLDCDFFIPYMVVYSISIMIGCSAIVPSYLLVVRSVESRDQSLASGACAFCQTLIGFLPSPILFGKLIDSTCLLWSSSSDYCMLYDRHKFRLNFNGVFIGIRSAHVIVAVLIILLIYVQRKKKGAINRTSGPGGDDDIR